MNKDSNLKQHLQEQYKNHDKLQLRISTHKLYSQPKIDFVEWVMDQIDWRGSEEILDVGCGNGGYIEESLRRGNIYWAGDFSMGMLKELDEESINRVNLDAQRLPFKTNRFDVILANHMLYYVPDQDAAVREFIRVLKSGGHLLAATNSRTTMSEFRTLSSKVATKVGLPNENGNKNYATDIDSFTLENGGALFKRHFQNVERQDLRTALIFTEAQPVIDYLGTMRERWVERLQTAGVSWQEVAQQMKIEIEGQIAEKGEYRVEKLSGVFVCRNN